MSNVYQDYKVPESDGGLYHSFEDGVTYVVRIASEPVVMQSEFVDQKTGESTLSTKYAWVIWNVESKTAQIMKLPVTAYRQIAALATDDEYGDPTNYNLKITRTGTGLETKYSVVASPKQMPLKDVEADAPAKTKEIDLIGRLESGKGVSQVHWLKDVLDGVPSRSEADKAEAKAILDEAMTRDKEAGEPVNLNDIPF